MPLSPARAAAFHILLRVETQDAYAAELLHSSLLEDVSPRDRGLTTEIVMGVLRWRSRLDEAIAAASSRPIAKLDPEVLTALRISAYQLKFLARIPHSAAINESVELVKRARKTSAAAFANAVLRKLTFADVHEAAGGLSEDSADYLAQTYSHPQWLVQRWIEQFGANAAWAICRQGQRVPDTAVRLEEPGVEEELKKQGVELSPGVLVARARVATAGDLTRSAAFREGRVVIQDEGSQLIALLVGHGARLLDCCAAPGGKTALLASRNPEAEIIAAELHPHRADLLRKRVLANNVQVINADAMALPLQGRFDRVLADVPCSGTGTLARNPEIKWRLTPDDLRDLHSRQVAILRAAMQQLTPGGRAVYSTCSLEREENEAVVEEVLSDTAGFQLRDCRDELERLRETGELAW